MRSSHAEGGFIMQDFKNRLVEFARVTYNFGQTRFEDYCGINHGVINSIKIKGPSAEIITKIALKCPELNLNWLFRGEGEMLNAPELDAQASAAPGINIGNIQTVNIGNWGELVEALKTSLKNNSL